MSNMDVKYSEGMWSIAEIAKSIQPYTDIQTEKYGLIFVEPIEKSWIQSDWGWFNKNQR